MWIVYCTYTMSIARNLAGRIARPAAARLGLRGHNCLDGRCEGRDTTRRGRFRGPGSGLLPEVMMRIR